LKKTASIAGRRIKSPIKADANIMQASIEKSLVTGISLIPTEPNPASKTTVVDRTALPTDMPVRPSAACTLRSMGSSR
jgi:hypothetical protein